MKSGEALLVLTSKSHLYINVRKAHENEWWLQIGKSELLLLASNDADHLTPAQFYFQYDIGFRRSIYLDQFQCATVLNATRAYDHNTQHSSTLSLLGRVKSHHTQTFG